MATRTTRSRKKDCSRFSVTNVSTATIPPLSVCGRDDSKTMLTRENREHTRAIRSMKLSEFLYVEVPAAASLMAPNRLGVEVNLIGLPSRSAS